jgi:hypothetical protein
VEDEVNYLGNSGGWPDTTTGSSLNRTNAGNGNLVSNWTAAAPTPGNMIMNYAAWKTLYFPGGGAGSADHEDPDQDGFDNVLEFAFGLSPLVANAASAVLPQVTSQPGAGGSTDFLFTYTRPLSAPGVTYTVQQSSNLSAWTPVADFGVGSTATTETRRSTVNSTAGTRLYFRLNVTIAP